MKKIFIVLIILAGCLYATAKGKAPVVSEVETVTIDTGEDAYIELEWPQYSPWEVVTLDGKLKMKGLPLSPGVKIFMQNGKLVTISLRAPFMGEVGRLDLTPEKLTIINKMNKTYVEESIGDRGVIGGKILGIKDIQDLLLGRFFLPGYDVSNVDLESLVDIFYEDDQINVIPKEEAEIEGVKYGFAVDEKFNPQLLVVVPKESGDRDIEVSAEYMRKLSGYNLTFAYGEGNRSYEMTFEFKEPEWKGDSPKAIDLNGKYRKVTFGEFMNGLK